MSSNLSEQYERQERWRHWDEALTQIPLKAGELTPASFGQVDGVWASFVAAYFSDLESAVARWTDCITPGGWLTLVEMDDLFGHQPLPSSISDEMKEFYASARAAGRYDFQCGRRLAGAAERAGLTTVHEGTQGWTPSSRPRRGLRKRVLCSGSGCFCI
jgi:hypothetical protein